MIVLKFKSENDNLIRLSQKYWELDSEFKFVYRVNDLAEEFGVSPYSLNKLISEHCEAFSTVIVCENCGKQDVFFSRSDFQEHHRLFRKKKTWLCSDCSFARQSHEVEVRLVLERKRQALIREHYSLSRRSPSNIKALSFENAVYLLSFIRYAGTEDLDFAWPFQSIDEPFAPTKDFEYDILKQLYRAGVIYVHPESKPSAFEFENDLPNTFYLNRVMWALPIHEKTADTKGVVEELEEIFRTMNWPEDWHDQQIDLWRKIALQECLQYLNVTTSEHGFSFNPGEKTELVFKNLLEDYSVSQAYNLVWRAVKDAAAFYMRERVSKKHAANTVVGSIQRQLDRARAEGWEIKKYRRDRRCPQSMISQVLYDTVLQIGEDGFNRPPG
jgi:hypothetical protein